MKENDLSSVFPKMKPPNNNGYSHILFTAQEMKRAEGLTSGGNPTFVDVYRYSHCRAFTN